MDMLDSRGLARPTCWKELEAVARRLLQSDELGRITAFGYCKAHTAGTNLVDLQVAMEQLGSSLIATEATKSNLRTPTARQALSFVKSMVQAGMPNSTGGKALLPFWPVGWPFSTTTRDIT
jgi:ABC-type glycerol-3-phosphate transport system substrate-binding protein